MIYVIFILPLLMLLIGFIMFKHPPKKINIFIGYRSIKSMKNKKNWNFANQYCGKIWIIIGIIMLIVTSLFFVVINLKKITLTEEILSIIVLSQLIPMLLSIFITENKIKNYE